jgi:16S rRNA (uracil1498-N3)-methyltransferase
MSPPRLFVDQPLAAGVRLALGRPQAHYLRHVLRLRAGDMVLAFNGTEGEWAARLDGAREPALLPVELLRPQRPEPGPTLLVAPIKRPRLEWLLEKAVELGVGRILPVLTGRGVVRTEASERLRARIVEAAEQCGRLTVPEVAEPMRLGAAVDAATAAAGLLGFADEAGGGVPLLAALEAEPLDALLVGPEGGFAPAERAALLARPQVRPVSLGPLILRTETAAIYAMACWRAVAERRAGGAAGASSPTIRDASTGGDSR